MAYEGRQTSQRDAEHAPNLKLIADRKVTCGLLKRDGIIYRGRVEGEHSVTAKRSHLYRQSGNSTQEAILKNISN